MAKERKKRISQPLTKAHTPFQAWVQPILNAKGWNSARLAEEMNRLPGTVWKAVSADPAKYEGAGKPGYGLALDIGKALGDEAGALKAAGHDVPAGIGGDPVPSGVYRALDRVASVAMEARDAYGASAEIFQVPFIGTVSASAGGELTDGDYTGEFIPVFVGMLPSKAANLFAFRVVGECLAGAHIVPGDVMICEPASEANTGEIVIVETPSSGERLAKRFRLLPGGAALLETDPSTGRPEIVSVGDDARIVGVVRLIQRIPGR